MDEQLGGLVCAPVYPGVVSSKFIFQLTLPLGLPLLNLRNEFQCGPYGAIITENLGHGTQIAYLNTLWEYIFFFYKISPVSYRFLRLFFLLVCIDVVCVT